VIDESVSVCFTDAGLYCGPDGTCHGMGKVGAPCVPEGCVPGAVCDAKSDTCIKRPALKPPFAACKSGSECTSRVCTDGACVFGLALSCAHPFASEPAS
jgi:hypothetical protein